jgi:hypothetical protein
MDFTPTAGYGAHYQHFSLINHNTNDIIKIKLIKIFVLSVPCWHWERVPAELSFSQRFSPSVTATNQNHPQPFQRE